MKMKKVFSLFVVCILALGCLGARAAAAEVKRPEYEVGILATGQFNMEVPGNTAVQANSSFPLEAGEIVTIRATYSPYTASVEFGLIAPDGLFYSVDGEDGSVNQAFEVDERGNYFLAVRNNSSVEISVSGYVNY